MANINKVVVNGSTVIDTSEVTVQANKMASGVTALDKTGTVISGTLVAQAAKTVTPTKATQTAVASGRYTTGAVSVGPIPSEYIIPSGSQTLTENKEYDVTALSEVLVSVPGKLAGTKNSATGLFTLASASKSVTIPLNLSFTPNLFFIFLTTNPTTWATDYAAFVFKGVSAWSNSPDAYGLDWYKTSSGSTIVSVRSSKPSVTQASATVGNGYTGGTGSNWRAGTYRWIALEVGE